MSVRPAGRTKRKAPLCTGLRGQILLGIPHQVWTSCEAGERWLLAMAFRVATVIPADGAVNHALGEVAPSFQRSARRLGFE